MEMGFYIKKFITFFVEPYGMIFSLLILGLYFLFTKKEIFAKVFLSLSFALLLLFSYPPFSNFLVKNLETQYLKYDYNHQITYIHVLGSGHNTDETQPLSSQIGNAGIKRVLEGVLIHKQVENSKLIFTGFEGSTDTPTAVMNARLARALGVKEENMIINPDPKDTKEEALFTKTLLDNEEFVLVTSATHMPRSMMLFNSLGLNPIPAPTNFYKNDRKDLLQAPNVHSLANSQIAVHEYLGILWAKLR